MILCEITDDLWVNPKRVISVERRTIRMNDGTDKTYTELTMETHTRWSLDIPLQDVIQKLTLW